MNSSANAHLSHDLIIRTLDDELTTAERFECDSHLAVCAACSLELASFRELSLVIETTVLDTVVPEMGNARLELANSIEAQAAPPTTLQNPARVLRRFGWGMGIAATLAFGLLTASNYDLWPHTGTPSASSAIPFPQAGTIEVDGETFVPVPYSNADVPTSTPHIVQMQVPVSSLTDAGIVLEPLMNREGAGSEVDSSVLADVLVGADGQPRGVHVLGFE